MNNASSISFRLASFLGFVSLALLLSPPATTQAKVQTYPQIVRLSYVQGDVRFCRGDGKSPDLTKPWEQAEVNVPILKGYSVTTGNGRAEIEFEYGSTVYLAENPVLLFHTLTTEDGVPTTEMELVTGTVTLSLHPIPKEVIELTTPTEQIHFVEPVLVRIDSYLDGATVIIHGNGYDDVIQGYFGSIVSRQRRAPGQAALDHSGTPADWDDWVDARVKQRQADTAAAFKASGLTSFIPGLTDLYNGGTFFACPPFGTCWEPKPRQDTVEISSTAQSSPVQLGSALSTGPSVSSGAAQIPTAGAPAAGAPATTAPTDAAASSGNAAAESSHVTSAQASTQQGVASTSEPAAAANQQQIPPTAAAATPAKKVRPKFSSAYYPLPDCYLQLRVMTARDPITRKETVVDRSEIPSAGYWPWALCHSGAWVHLRNRGTHYTFVVHHKRHHPPVVWVHGAKGDGYVPKHPSDAKGKPPLNLKYGVIVAQKGLQGSQPTFEHVAFAPTEKYKVLTAAPKEFREAKYPQLPPAQRPEIHARLVSDLVGAKAAAPAPGMKSASTSTSYDYKSRKFVQAGAPMPGRTSKPVVVGRLGARGGYSPSVGTWASGSRGTTSAGGARSGGTGGRVSAGGGRAGGGGASSGGSRGGGASQGGGGGRSAPAPSASPRKPG